MQNYFVTTAPPVFTTDFHYFRIAREKWEFMLTRLRQMGIDMITISVPWGFHELSQGKVDLNGATNARRDLLGLLKLATALNFNCLLNIGPYCPNSGILADGLPSWLSPDSDTFNTVLAGAVEAWFKALSKDLVKYQWPNGPITALYIDDASLQDSVPAYSTELTEVKWPIWLRKRYQGMDALNEAYGTTYRNVSVVPFPTRWSQKPAPLEKDARTFLAEVQGDIQSNYEQTLIDAGWQIPIHSTASEASSTLPVIQNQSLINPAELTTLESDKVLLNLQHPIQIESDPTDIGDGPVWAGGAPIRADGSLRRTFWEIRHFLWSQTLPNAASDAGIVTLSFEAGGLITTGQDAPLKVVVETGTKPAIYRLRHTGKLLPADSLKVARTRLSGPYVSEDNTVQTDLVFYLNDPAKSLTGFVSLYLQMLLKGQHQTLVRCAALATELGQVLDPNHAPAEVTPSRPAKSTPYTIAEARRGLSEADKILRKAMSAIGGLEGGFDTMLSRTSRAVPEPAASSLPIRPEIFEGEARDIVIKAGRACQTVAPNLKSAAEKLQQILDAPQTFTLDQYQSGYIQAVNAAHNAREPLLDVVAELRLEIAAEKLPLVIWRVHNQVQEIAESLRWGVLRG